MDIKKIAKKKGSKQTINCCKKNILNQQKKFFKFKYVNPGKNKGERY